jgi:hypothetical protein
MNKDALALAAAVIAAGKAPSGGLPSGRKQGAGLGHTRGAQSQKRHTARILNAQAKREMRAEKRRTSWTGYITDDASDASDVQRHGR